MRRTMQSPVYSRPWMNHDEEDASAEPPVVVQKDVEKLVVPVTSPPSGAAGVSSLASPHLERVPAKALEAYIPRMGPVTSAFQRKLQARELEEWSQASPEYIAAKSKLEAEKEAAAEAAGQDSSMDGQDASSSPAAPAPVSLEETLQQIHHSRLQIEKLQAGLQTTSLDAQRPARGHSAHDEEHPPYQVTIVNRFVKGIFARAILLDNPFEMAAPRKVGIEAEKAQREAQLAEAADADADAADPRQPYVHRPSAKHASAWESGGLTGLDSLAPVTTDLEKRAALHEERVKAFNGTAGKLTAAASKHQQEWGGVGLENVAVNGADEPPQETAAGAEEQEPQELQYLKPVTAAQKHAAFWGQEAEPLELGQGNRFMSRLEREKAAWEAQQQKA